MTYAQRRRDRVHSDLVRTVRGDTPTDRALDEVQAYRAAKQAAEDIRRRGVSFALVRELMEDADV